MPQMLHQAHVRAIIEIPGPKEGNSKERRRLHDACSQHLRVLKTMGHNPSGPFMKSLIEMKLDWSTMYEWQRPAQESSDMPHCVEILQFINL